MAVSSSIITSSVITSTSQHKRDYSERIRRRYPSITKILALVKGSSVDDMGNTVYNKGLIDKKPAKRLDPEWANYTPIDVSYAATGGSATTATMADTSSWQTGDKIVNVDTLEVAIVDTITNATTLTVTAVAGGTWSCAAGNTVIMLGSTYEEGSSRYGVRTKELDTYKTYLNVGREAISLAETIMKTPQYTEEGMMERYWTDHMTQVLRKIEADYLLSKQTSGAATTSVTIGGTAYPMYSMNGIMSYAGAAIDMGGTFNWETFNTVMYPLMPNLMYPDETIYMVCGRRVSAAMHMWAQNKYMRISQNKNERFGEGVDRYIMGGGLEIEVLVHDVFEQGALANQCVFFQSSDLVYRYMEGLDIAVHENIQLPSTMGTTNELRWALGLQSMSNGAAIKRFTNLLAAA